MKTRPLIGIMVNNAKPLPSYNLAEDVGVNLLVFNNKGINWSKEQIDGFILEQNKWSRTISPFPAVVYNRRYLSKRTVTDKIEKIIGKDMVFNCVTRFDKLEIDSILRQSRLRDHLPDTVLYHKNNILPMLEKYNTLILKPCFGCLGRQVYLLECINGAEYHLYHNLNIPKIVTADEIEYLDSIDKLVLGNRFMVQQFIDVDQIGQNNYDIRFYVQKDGKGKWTVSGGFSRISYANCYISNFCLQPGSIEYILAAKNRFSKKRLKKINMISLQAADLIETKLGHLGEISVDFVIGRSGKPWLIEVNGRTQKAYVNRLQDEKLTHTVYLKPIEYARFLAEK